MMQRIPCVVGVSFHESTFDVLDAVAVAHSDRERVCSAFRDTFACEDVVLLSTCNRTELYFSATDPTMIEDAATWLSQTATPPVDERLIYRHFDEAAVRHLFAVICGLDAMIVGETEIAGQVQQAFDDARQRGWTSAFFVQLFTHGFQCGKRIKNTTHLGRGSTSIAATAVHMLKDALGGLVERPILVLGAGETGKSVCHHLAQHSARIVVANRTPEKAQALARQIDGTSIPLDGLVPALKAVDGVICAAGADTPLIHPETIAAADRRDKGRLHILDIALPHNVDPMVKDIPDVTVRNMSDMKHIVAQAIAARNGERPRAADIIEREVAAFRDRQRINDVAPVIRQLRDAYDAVRREELNRHKKRLDDDTLAVVTAVTQSIQNKLLHRPTTYLREAAQTPTDPQRVDQFIRIFGLEDVGTRDTGHRN